MKIFVYDREYILLSPRCHQTYYFILSLVLYRNMVWVCRNGYHAAWCARDMSILYYVGVWQPQAGSLACKLDPQVASSSTRLRGPVTKRLCALWLCNYHQKPPSGISSPTQSTACSISLARYVRSRYLCNHYRCLFHGLWDSGDY